MKSAVLIHTDARQSREWGKFLSHIGWNYKVINGIYVFYRQLPLTNRTLIKIQHPKGPLPLKAIDAFASQVKALFVIIEPHTEGFDAATYLDYDYTLSTMRFAHSATRIIDIEPSEEKLLASFSPNVRRNLKKAQKQLVISQTELSEGSHEVSIQTFYYLYRHLGSIRKFYVPSFHEVSEKIAAFQKTSVLLFAYEKHDTKQVKPIATLWVGYIGKTLIYFHPGNTERGYELLANYLLIWEAIRWGKAQGLRIMDFETAYDKRYPKENIQWKGYTKFKEKFGGELVEYPPSYIKFYNPVAKCLYSLGTLFSR